MIKIFLILLLNIKILPEISSAEFQRYGSNDSIQPIQHNSQISRITLTTPDLSFVGCVLNVGGVMLKFKPTENTDCTLEQGITLDTQLQTNPPNSMRTKQKCNTP